MSVWTAPITWTAAAVTAAQMNAEIRDHASFLKGFGDLITASTTADTGTSTYLSITRTATAQTILDGKISGDANPRVRVLSSGVVEWGDGTSAPDLQLTRVVSTSAGLTLNGYFQASRATGLGAFVARVTGDSANRFQVLTNGGLSWGDGSAAVDVTLQRAAANVLELPSSPATKLRLTGTAASTIELETQISTDTNPRLRVSAGGKHEWGPGGVSALDATFERPSAGVLQATDTVLQAERVSSTGSALRAKVTADADWSWRVSASGTMEWAPGTGAVDTNLYRNAANVLKTDDTFDALAIRTSGTQVLTTRQTGWTAATNTKLRTTFDTTTVTLPNLAARVGALLDDLITHGVIGA